MKATATTVHKLIQGSKVFLIPTFQRRYTWRKPQWAQLWGDLLAEYELDHPEDPDALYGHFLGSVVLHPALGPASTLMRHQVIDGQQRLTTILILLAAMRDARRDADPSWVPAAIDDQYLRNPYSADYPDRLVPTKLDREAYEKTVRLQTPTGDIGIAYNFFRTALSDFAEAASGDLDRLQNTLLLHMLMVEITTKSGDSVNGIFNTLNSKGLDLSAADLVRNEVLHHVGESASEDAHDRYWIPMEQALVLPKSKLPDREFVTFLWAREVALNSKTSRDDLFAVFETRLRSTLHALAPADRSIHALSVLAEMYDDHLLFLMVRDPDRAVADPRVSANLAEALQAVRDWRSEPATPVVLWILKQAVEGHVEQTDAAEALRILLSYLVKRILNGIPTNQLNRLLTPIAHDLATRPVGEPLAARLHRLLSKQGYYWPTDEQVLQTVTSNPIYASARRYVKFLLSIVEDTLPGKEFADLSKSQIDHVMPQALSAEWRDHLARGGIELTDAEALTHTLGNLTLTDNNQKMGNATFATKKTEFFDDSALRLNRALADYGDFLPPDIEERGVAFAKILLDAFPHKPITPIEFDDASSGASLDERLKSLLQNLPVSRWVVENDLVSVLGATDEEIRSGVCALDATLARLVRTEDRLIPDWFGSDLEALVTAQDDAQFALGRRMSSDELNDLAAVADGDGREPDEDGDDAE